MVEDRVRGLDAGADDHASNVVDVFVKHLHDKIDAYFRTVGPVKNQVTRVSDPS